MVCLPDSRDASMLSRRTFMSDVVYVDALQQEQVQLGLLPLQGSAVNTKQMSWSGDCAERCDILLAADILYDPGKAHLLIAH